MKRADEAFRGDYAAETEELLGLSRTEIDEITPGALDLETYDRLIEVVKEASRVNVEQAELKRRIESLGDVAVRIAKKVTGLGALL
jgi:hypothetical protein